MINPLFASPQTVVVNLQAQDPGRQANQPDPAQVVTAAETALDARLNPGSPQQQAQNTEPKPLDDTLDDLNARMQAWSTGLRFNVDEDAQRVVVSIVDSATGEVLRTVPSDAVLKVAKMIVQMQGQMVNTKA